MKVRRGLYKFEAAEHYFLLTDPEHIGVLSSPFTSWDHIKWGGAEVEYEEEADEGLDCHTYHLPMEYLT